MFKNLLFQRLWIGRYAGIDTYLHWSWLLMVGLFFLFDVHIGILVTAIFACVLLHEFGHCLAAQRFGVEVKNIHLFPVGGVAQIAMTPDKPKEEFWVTVAGPAVNVVLAGMFFLMTLFLTPVETEVELAGFGMWEWSALMCMMNLFLAGFNLLPIFPMDGGRMLRAGLSWSTGNFLWATKVAARIGQVLCLGLIGIGVWINAWSWIIIGLLIMVFAEAEVHNALNYDFMKRNGKILDSIRGMSEKELFELLAKAKEEKDAVTQDTVERILAIRGSGLEDRITND